MVVFLYFCVTMVYDEQLAEKVRRAFQSIPRVEEKKMMGGLTFMVNGKMCIGILKDDLMVRLDPVVYDVTLKQKGCREMNFTGRPMKGFVFVSPEGTSNKKDFNYWINLALDFNNRAKSSKKNKKYGTRR